MRQSPWLHPILFALFPILFLFTQNIAEMQLLQLVRPVLILALVAFLFTLLLRLIIRSANKAAVLASVVLFLFLSFGRMVGALGYEPNHWMDIGFTMIDPNIFIGALCTLICLIVAVWVIVTRKKLLKLTRFLNTFALVLIASQVLFAAYGLITKSAAGHTQLAQQQPLQMPQSPPDIYFIVVDAYGRSDVLQELYGYNNSDFLAHLKGRGFLVAEYATSNYCQTMLSLGATLNLDYIDRLIKCDRNSFDRTPLSVLLQNNYVMRSLQDNGYQLVACETGFEATVLKNADVNLSLGFVLSEFEHNVLNSTPIRSMLKNFLPQFALHRKRIESILNQLADLEPRDEPMFVFAHIGCPHPPFVFGPNGEPIDPDRNFDFGDGTHYFERHGTPEEYVVGYRNQITYLSRRLAETVDAILAHYPDQPPVIIIQGDHGPGSQLDWQDPKKSNHRERLSILNACLLPGVDTTRFYDQITPINTFRVLMNTYFGTRFPRLPDYVIFSPWTRPYMFFNVTDVVRVAPPVIDSIAPTTP